MKLKLAFVLISGLAVTAVAAGCALASSAQEATRSSGSTQVRAAAPPESKAQIVPASALYTAQLPGAPAQPSSNTTCALPAGWVPYQVQLNETVYSLAARAGIAAADLLAGNCLLATNAPGPGAWLYVPPAVALTRAETLLPLGIGALVTDPQTVPAGGTVHLTWLAQGPVVSVRIGWLYQGQFIEERAGLPTTGTLPLTVPADGRESMTFVLLASDGLREVAAQTTVHITCPESWFFGPTPAGCPYPPLITTLREQPFERGTVVYIPALGTHYVFIAGQPGQRVPDAFVPGMPTADHALDAAIPPGLRQPEGPINYLWRSDEARRAALGYAVGPEIAYTGMVQRAVSSGGEVVYFSSGSGQVYRFAGGQTWQLIQPH